jgi:hypothetical protein
LVADAQLAQGQLLHHKRQRRNITNITASTITTTNNNNNSILIYLRANLTAQKPITKLARERSKK